jgi:altronate dehydratase small subunit
MKSKDIQKPILSHPEDNVATAIFQIKAGTFLQIQKGEKVKVKEQIPFGHKVALRRIPKGGCVVKYGECIGRAIRAIEPGELVHTHNVEGKRGKRRK